MADWGQVLRYIAGLDPVQPLGGPAALVAPLAPASLTAGASPRAVTVHGNGLAPGQPGTISIRIAAEGGETGLSCTLQFDPNHMTCTGARVEVGRNSVEIWPKMPPVAVGRDPW